MDIKDGGDPSILVMNFGVKKEQNLKIASFDMVSTSSVTRHRMAH